MAKGFTYLERCRMQSLLSKKVTVRQVAEIVGKNRQSTYREVHRGLSEEDAKEYRWELYSADMAQNSLVRKG